MSYEPTNWKDGDIVTSAKLNKLEQGIAGAGDVMIVHWTEGTGGLWVLNKTWQELYDAQFAVLSADYSSEGSPGIWKFPIHVINADVEKHEYSVYFIGFDTSDDGYPYLFKFIASAPNEYPVQVMG